MRIGPDGKSPQRRTTPRPWERRLPTMGVLAGRERTNPLRGVADGFGRLEQVELPAFVRKIEARRANGVLHLSHDGIASRLYFREGALVFAGSDIGEDLGARLLRQGKIREVALREARREVAENEDELGAFLVRRKLVSRETVRLAQMQQMMSIVDSMLTCQHLYYRFAETDHSLDPEREIPLSVSELILAAVRRSTDADGILRKLGGDPEARILGVDGELSGRLECNERERPILELISTRPAGLAIREVLAQATAGREAALQGLYGLLAMGAIELSPAGRAPILTGEVEDPRSAHTSSEETLRRIGPYEVHCPLGGGTSGSSFRARDPQRSLTVLVKLLPAPKDASASIAEKWRRKFYRDARIVAERLDHPGLVNLLDVGFSRDDEPYLVWEYVEAYSLETLMAARELNLRETLSIAKQMLEALAHAHAKGFAHTTLCPHKIFVAADLRIKIRGLGPPDATGALVRPLPRYRVPYIAPEQVNGRRGDERSDVFSFGAILYQMMTRRLPFEGSTVPDLVHERLTQDAVPPSVFNRAVTTDLSAFVLRCLHRDRNVRFETAGEALLALERELARRVAGSAMVTAS